MNASSLLGVDLVGVSLFVFGLVKSHDEFFADRVRLQDDVVSLPILVRESGSDVEPVIILLRALNDRVHPVHLSGLFGHDAPSFLSQAATCSVASGNSPRA